MPGRGGGNAAAVVRHGHRQGRGGGTVDRDRDPAGAGMAGGIVDGLLRDVEQRAAHRRVELVGGAGGAVGDLERGAGIAAGAFEMHPHRMGEAEQVEQGRHRLVDDPAQIADRLAQLAGEHGAGDRRIGRHLAQEPRQIGEGLVVQVHADALALLFEGLCQLQRAAPQPLFRGAARLGGAAGPAGPFGEVQDVEPRREGVGDLPGKGDGRGIVDPGAGVRQVQRADQPAHHPQRHVHPAAQVVVQDRLAGGAGIGVAGIAGRVLCQHVVALAEEQGADRRVIDPARGARPAGADPDLVADHPAGAV